MMVDKAIKTKKIRKCGINKKDMWNSFEEGIKSENNPIECIYRNSGQREFCDCCESRLIVTEEGFQTCINPKCGIVYKDILDHTAEWRFYGADDNHADPTRAGLLKLLKESSFGCKVICSNHSTYEMRKIRRFEWQSMPYREKSQYDEFQRITILASQAGIPKLIIDDAMRYHKKISKQNISRTQSRWNHCGIDLRSSTVNDYPRTAKERNHLPSGQYECYTWL